MRQTPFGAILREVVEHTPGAVGGAFAAADGETVDAFTQWDPADWAILTAHYGIVLSQVQAALHTFHYGDATLLTFSHANMDVLICTVGEGYFALMAVEPPGPLGRAMVALDHASELLRLEMF